MLYFACKLIYTDGRAGVLHNAIRFGANDVVEYLVAQGADLNAKDRFGRTPLEEAEFEAPVKTIELMRKLTAEKAGAGAAKAAGETSSPK